MGTNKHSGSQVEVGNVDDLTTHNEPTERQAGIRSRLKNEEHK